ncbi:MAG: HIT family protein [Candidatus Colwellbacteria bacterium CG10_big_fil_rev_8_21_14_0_10_42_22]|uniref:HIT family protein n=1 Tax=Candidatus Colwellbacteria bacterium CG10_big_fil_rev_8_21_14_0_10_42_22 TaxID=1974540 RepID=A0A2H0VIK9_9BACT|nr:MAG: HIT family protein [Candidatus Colwellbacteria bacterium CG10_big_fil_rev_8_21_14_0_10_42_22]
MDCLFCKIAKGDIPTHKIYENDDSIAFLDINPSADGHTMVISKNHHENIQDIPEDLLGKLSKTVKRVVDILEKGLKTTHFTIGLNNGKLSGQEIDHLHIHIIPRNEGDGGGSIQSVVQNRTENPEKIKEKILKANG